MDGIWSTGRGLSSSLNPLAERVLPPVCFEVVEGQFDDAEEDIPLNENKDKNSQNLDALFRSTLKCSEEDQKEPNNPDGREYSAGEDDSDFDEYTFYDEKTGGPNSQKQHEQVSAKELFRKYENKIKIEKYEGVEQLPSGAGNKIISSRKKLTANRQKVKDKQDRATVEQVLDPRTRMILYKLLSTGKIVNIDGCISTGKEANVYHATGPEGQFYAVKIFKTSILTFKARDKYVSGEYRFRQGYSKKNPRKMVGLWAEKEFRNLVRIHSSDKVLVPQPRLLKSHVIVMDFIGSHGWPSPLLKDVKFENIEFEEETTNKENLSEVGTDVNDNPLQKLLKKLYRDCLLILYHLYKDCKLVHADFSEYNLILKDDKELYVIDVSQSVEHDHPRSFDFLRSDIKNIQDFFGKRIFVGDFKDIFDFITSPTIDDSNYEENLNTILKASKKWEYLDVSTEVFRQSFIPRKMEEVEHFERDYNSAKTGETNLIYTNVMGMKADFSGPELNKEGHSKGNPLSSESQSETLSIDNGDGSQDASGSDSDADTFSSVDGESKSKNKTIIRPKNETPEERKERKALAKQEKAVKRLTKVKKHVKKRQEKLMHHNSKKK